MKNEVNDWMRREWITEGRMNEWVNEWMSGGMKREWMNDRLKWMDLNESTDVKRPTG